MRIAVDAVFLNNSEFRTFLELAASHQQDDFLFFLDEANHEDFQFSKNSIPVTIPLKSNSRLSLNIRFDLRIPIALKKHKADIFISKYFISGRSKIPQLLLLPDLSFIFQPSLYKKSTIRFFKKNIATYLNKAEKIITNCNFHKNEIISRFKINEEKIKVLDPEISKRFIELNFEEREIFKEKYADGNEYFVYAGTISPQQNLLNLLKAFSFFKKRQKSKMQLIILGKRGSNYDEFAASLRLFRFKEEVKIVEHLPEKEKEEILASSYAMLYLPVYVTDLEDSLEAMRIGVPALVSSTGLMQDLYADAALYADPNNFKDIADKMMLIFKDEKLRKELITKKSAQLQRFTEKRTEDTFYKIIENISTKNPLK